MLHKIYIAGMGPGSKIFLRDDIKNIMHTAAYVIADKRSAPLICGNYIPLKIDDIFIENLKEYQKTGDILLCVSGDPLYYSLAKMVVNSCNNTKILPNLGSVEYLAAHFGMTLECFDTVSIHGREINKNEIFSKLESKKKLFFFCSKEHGPKEVAELLIENGFSKYCKIFGGFDLSYESEGFFEGSPENIAKIPENPNLCVICVKYENKEKIEKFLLDDTDFFKGNIPMTKQEVRSVILSKSGFKNGDIIWDIGAGAGSVSVEFARHNKTGTVYSVECNPDAAEILKKNKNKFLLYNMKIIEGRAAKMIHTLPYPDIVFLGGSDGEAKSIIDYLKLNKPEKDVKVIMSSVTLESLGEILQNYKHFKGFDLTELEISRYSKLGKFTKMKPNNKVTIAVFNI